MGIAVVLREEEGVNGIKIQPNLPNFEWVEFRNFKIELIQIYRIS
jgi:hypothetical protein